MDYISKLKVEHEDVMMKMFSHSLVEIGKDWFHVFGKGEINTFVGFIKVFHKYWDSSYKEEEPKTPDTVDQIDEEPEEDLIAAPLEEDLGDEMDGEDSHEEVHRSSIYVSFS
jgi:hypothetical protein